MEKLKREEGKQDEATETTKKDGPNEDNDSNDDENLTLEEFLKEVLITVLYNNYSNFYLG